MGGLGEVRIETTAQLVAEQERSATGVEVRVRLLPAAFARRCHCSKAAAAVRQDSSSIISCTGSHSATTRSPMRAGAEGRDARDLRDYRDVLDAGRFVDRAELVDQRVGFGDA